MPRVRIENHPGASWLFTVARPLLSAFLTAEVPGIMGDETKITLLDGGHQILRNNRIVSVVVDDLFHLPGRDKGVRDRLARALGDAVKPHLIGGWEVEVVIHRFDPKVDSYYTAKA